MFAAGAVTTIRTVMEKPIPTSFPLAQLVLGSIGLCSMVSYVILRQRIIDKRESGQQVTLTTYLFLHIREWLGGHHGAAGHAGSGK